MQIVIYGAQAIALGVYKAIKTLFPNQEISCFLVTEIKKNALVLGGIPVRELHEFAAGMSQEDKDNTEVLIGTPEAVMKPIEKSLEEAGLYCHVRVDSIRWAQMQQAAFIKTGKFMPLAAYPVGFHMPELQIYKIVHHKDTELMCQFEDPEYIHNLQVGAADTGIRIADNKDNEGENISAKNRNYSELTGLYWMWKNQVKIDADNLTKYYGLAHYRRVFDLSEDDQRKLVDNDIDAVLPYPMPYEPDIEEHHKRYLSDSEWNAVMQALEELQPEDAEAFKDILKQGYLYNYNIIIAKGKVLDDYCSWLFPLLFRIEEINDPKGTKNPNRYMGYVGETLETLYFMHNKQNLKIAHAGCRFLV